MLGHRGCRLAVTYPEILEMQVTAIAEAVIACKEKKIDAQAEIMIPLVGTRERAEDAAPSRSRQTIDDGAGKEEVQGQARHPRRHDDRDSAGLRSRPTRSPSDADFFSFGTNDLTQMTFGFSRDDINTFLPDYLRAGNPAARPVPVARHDAASASSSRWASRKGRSAKKGLKCGICGEHGGDPDSIQFCHKVGLDYVSCSPFRVPIARLAAAQAALKQAGADSGRKGE